MKRRYILAKPPRAGIGLLDGHGLGGPDDQQPQRGPGRRQTPVKPSGPSATDIIGGQVTKQIGDALGAAAQKFVQDILPAGEVLLGAVLVVVGLLVATGLASKGAKAGAFVGSRGLIR